MERQMEQNGIAYNLVGDFYLPDLKLPQEAEKPQYGHYGRMRLAFLKKNHRFAYKDMLYNGKLNSHLNSIDRDAKTMLESLVKQMAESQGITEQLKANDQLKWVGLMNNIRNAVNEIVLNDLIYA